MTFRNDVRPRYSDPLCSPREFPRRTDSDIARYGTHTYIKHTHMHSRGEDYIINSPKRETIALHGRAFLRKGTSRAINQTLCRVS